MLYLMVLPAEVFSLTCLCIPVVDKHGHPSNGVVLLLPYFEVPLIAADEIGLSSLTALSTRRLMLPDIQTGAVLIVQSYHKPDNSSIGVVLASLAFHLVLPFSPI